MQPARRLSTRLPAGIAGQAGFLLLVAASGAGMGLVAVCFRALLNEANQLFFGSFHGLDLTTTLLNRPYVALVPAAGGLIVGIYFRFIVRRPPGHGVSEVIVALETRGSRIPWISSVHTAIGSVVTIGSGGSAGPEGPIISIGAALASGLGQALRLRSDRLRVLLACGASAGLAGMYHAPLTGAAFAAEVLLVELEARSFSLLALAAVIGSAVAGGFEAERAVTLPALPPAPWQDVPLDIVLGLLAAPCGVLLIIGVHRLGELVAEVRRPMWLKPAAGGLVVGVGGLLLPRILGSGESGLQQIVDGHLALALLMVLPLAKVIATSVTLGSGATGGVFTPSLFMGAALGGSVGSLFGRIWSGASPVPTYALVGMGTVVAAAVNAPLTAVLLVCEFTHDFTLLPQIVAAVAASVLLARRLQQESIYTLPLAQLGIDRALVRSSTLARIRVADVMTSDWHVVAPELPLRRVLTLARSTKRSIFPVVDADTMLCGVLSLDRVTDELTRSEDVTASGMQEGADPAARDAMLMLESVAVVRLDASLHDAVLALASAMAPLPVLPVIDGQGRYAGMLERVAILHAYSIGAELHARSATRSKPTVS